MITLNERAVSATERLLSLLIESRMNGHEIAIGRVTTLPGSVGEIDVVLFLGYGIPRCPHFASILGEDQGFVVADLADTRVQERRLDMQMELIDTIASIRGLDSLGVRRVFGFPSGEDMAYIASYVIHEAGGAGQEE